MNRSWTGPAIVGLIVVGLGGFLFLNIQPVGVRSGGSPASAPATARVARDSPGSASADPAATPPPATLPESAPTAASGGAVREFPIGDEVERNHLSVAAVWLPAVMMDGMATSGADHPIHIEADVKATDGNPHGFSKDEKVAYLKIAYQVVPAAGGSPIAAGELTPMMARDGFHYGATIALPPAGTYRLIYALQPPSAGGLGRHSDPATGVAPWWEPFTAEFEWTVDPHAGEVTLR